MICPDLLRSYENLQQCPGFIHKKIFKHLIEKKQPVIRFRKAFISLLLSNANQNLQVLDSKNLEFG